MGYERPLRFKRDTTPLEPVLSQVATEFTGGPIDDTKWQIVGEYEGRTGVLYYVDKVPEGADPEFLARRIAERIQVKGGNVQAWPPKQGPGT